jgi:hypothetical protein
METGVAAVVTDGDRNRGGSSRQQQGQATINNMRGRLAALAMAGGGGGGERWWMKTMMAVAIAAEMAEEVVVATAAMVATVAEATVAETERQNSGAGILDIISGLANSGNMLASFLVSACAIKLFARQIWILAFAFFDSANTICKYKNAHFVRLSAYRGKKITLFGKNDLQLVSTTQNNMVRRRTPSSVKHIGVKNHSLRLCSSDPRKKMKIDYQTSHILY